MYYVRCENEYEYNTLMKHFACYSTYSNSKKYVKINNSKVISAGEDGGGSFRYVKFSDFAAIKKLPVKVKKKWTLESAFAYAEKNISDKTIIHNAYYNTYSYFNKFNLTKYPKVDYVSYYGGSSISYLRFGDENGAKLFPETEERTKDILVEIENDEQLKLLSGGESVFDKKLPYFDVVTGYCCAEKGDHHCVSFKTYCIVKEILQEKKYEICDASGGLYIATVKADKVTFGCLELTLEEAKKIAKFIKDGTEFDQRPTIKDHQLVKLFDGGKGLILFKDKEFYCSRFDELVKDILAEGVADKVLPW